MADLQYIPPSQQRRQLLELIEDQQQQALRKLRNAGLFEAQALAAMPRIRSYCMYALNEYDQAYMVIEEMVGRDGCSPAHDQFIADKGAFLLRQMEAGIVELVAFAIRQAIRDAEQPPVQTVIPAVRSQPRPS